MLQLTNGRTSSNCQGSTRRTALKVGVLSCLGMSMGDLLRLQAAGSASRNNKSVILMWLDGGPSQLETYDPKPDAPAEYRGPFGAISTNVPGIQLCETLPGHAKYADRMAFIRSLHHDNGDHFAAAHWMLTGRFGSTTANKAPMFPSVGSYVSRVKGPNVQGMPAFVGVPAAHAVYVYPGYQGAAYLGGSYGPFQINMKQKYLPATYTTPIKPPEFLASIEQADQQRSTERLSLLQQLDLMNREVDQSDVMQSMDQYQPQAADLIFNPQARQAFDVDKESPKLRDLYGRGPWGHYTLMARRLVESGVSFVTVDMPHWDNHSGIEKGHGSKLVHVDRAVSALMEDLTVRGMLDDVLLVVMGEFGRTPRLNKGQPGIPIPGRDHWGNAISRHGCRRWAARWSGGWGYQLQGRTSGPASAETWRSAGDHLSRAGHRPLAFVQQPCRPPDADSGRRCPDLRVVLSHSLLTVTVIGFSPSPSWFTCSTWLLRLPLTR